MVVITLLWMLYLIWKQCRIISQPNLDFKEIALAQADDAELTAYGIKAVPVPMADITVLCDVSTGTP